MSKLIRAIPELKGKEADKFLKKMLEREDTPKMTSEKFNLSKKIVKSPPEDYIDVSDIKEFIRLLKDKITPKSDYAWSQGFMIQNIEVIKIIDTLAGSQLTKDKEKTQFKSSGSYKKKETPQDE